MPDRRAVPSLDDLETRLAAAARAFPFPPTPDLSRAVDWQAATPRQKRQRLRLRLRLALALAGALVALLLAAVLAVPPVRAAVLDWIRIGAVRIFLVPPANTPLPTLPPGTDTPVPQPSPTPLSSILDITGETTLSEAQSRAGFAIRLPARLGQPDRVYYQDLGGPLVILVWIDPARPGSARLSLAETSASNIIFQKITPRSVEDTTVGGQPAVWVDSPYLLTTGSGDTVYARLVESGHTLVWTQGSLTLRLETAQDLKEAVKTAESIQ